MPRIYLSAEFGIISYTSETGDAISPETKVFASQLIAQKVFSKDGAGNPINYQVCLKYLNPSKGGEQYFLQFIEPTGLRLNGVDCIDAETFMTWVHEAIKATKDAFYTTDGFLSGDRIVDGHRHSLTYENLSAIAFKNEDEENYLSATGDVVTIGINDEIAIDSNGVSVNCPFSATEINGPINHSVLLKTDDYNIKVVNEIILFDPTAGNITGARLPNPALCFNADLGTSRVYTIKLVSNGGNKVTVIPFDAEQIDLGVNKVLSRLEKASFITNGVDWFII